MVNVSVSVFGLGKTVKTTVTSQSPVSCADACSAALQRESREVFLQNVTYMVNGKRAQEDQLLCDGDELIVMSILGGG